MQYFCLKTECKTFKALNPRDPKRYYCEGCMEKDHDHLPTKIVKIIMEIGDRWINLNQRLCQLENNYLNKMSEYSPLLEHFDKIAK